MNDEELEAEYDTMDKRTATLYKRVRDDDILINFNGHCGEEHQGIVYSKSLFARSPYNDEHYFFNALELILSELASEKLGEESPHEVWCKGGTTKPQRTTGFRDCYVCGERITTTFDGKVINFNTRDCAPCKYPGGIKDYTVTIDVPSGEIVFANDLRRLMEQDVDYEINNHNGVKLTVEDTALQGFFTVFVGNSCPGIFTKDDIITIGNEGLDDNDQPVADFGELVGSICTDLWWVYAMDKVAFDSHPSSSEIEIEALAQVEPGKYQMTVHSDRYLDGKGWEGGERFATIVKV